MKKQLFRLVNCFLVAAARNGTELSFSLALCQAELYFARANILFRGRESP